MSLSWTRVRPPPSWLRGQEVSQNGALAPGCLPARARSAKASGVFGSRGRHSGRLLFAICSPAFPLSLPFDLVGMGGKEVTQDSQRAAVP